MDSPQQMAADCRELSRRLDLPDPGPASRLERAARAAVRPAPSIRFEDYPRDVRKRDLEFTDAAARLAAALHLHLD